MRTRLAFLRIGAPLAMALTAPNYAFAACSNPTADTGTIIYNSTYSVVQVCNGTNWVGLGGNNASSSSEIDPKVGTLTNGKWCTTNGSVINCTSDQPSGTTLLSALTDVTLSSPVTGQVLTYNGSAWVNSTGSSGDRLTSGTLAVTANGATAMVSLSTGGTTWGYLGSTQSYVPNLSSLMVSSTNISVTALTVNGVAITGSGSSDRITSGTTAVVANTTGNVTVSGAVVVSGSLQAANNTGGACTSSKIGALAVIDGRLHVCRSN